MIDRAKAGGYQIHCDNCTNAIQITYAKDFKQTIEEAKESGWINRQINGEWNNFCSQECYEDKKKGEQ